MLSSTPGSAASVEKATTLERDNTALRLEISRLSSGERIAAEAQQLGLVMPNAGESATPTSMRATPPVPPGR